MVGVQALWKSGSINPEEMVVGFASKDGTAAFYGVAPTLGLIKPDKKQVTYQRPFPFVSCTRSWCRFLYKYE